MARYSIRMRLLYIFFVFLPLLHITSVHATSLIEIPVEADTYIEEKYPTTVTWNSRNLFLGTDVWYAKGKTRVLVKPDFSQLKLQDVLPSDIEKVELILTSYEYEGNEEVATIDTYVTTSLWSMFEVTWQLQPSISSKKDSIQIPTNPGVKVISVTNSFIEAFKSYPTSSKGLLLKINPETDKALIFWAHGCDIAPTPPQCSGELDRPALRVYLKPNTQPTPCSLKSLVDRGIINTPSLAMEPNPSTDPNGDALTYLGKICQDVNCNVIVWNSNLTLNSKIYVDLSDGTYFLSCAANDGHNNVVWGSQIVVNVDTLAPQIPIIIDEPPYTGTMQNTIFWYPLVESNILYQVQASERSSFSAYNSYTFWVDDTSVPIHHTKEKVFYYRVKAKDLAGNESPWSTVTSTEIDTSFPTLKYFKSNRTALSPKFDKSGKPVESAYIQGGVDDQTLAIISLTVKDKFGTILYTETVEEKSYLWTHWPDKPGYSDDNYILQLIAVDSLGNTIQSDPLLLEVDSTPPSKANISGFKDKQLLNTSRFAFTAACNKNELATVYSGGKIVAKDKQSHQMTLIVKDGQHNIAVACTDKVGNKSEIIRSVTIDTTPPQPPNISFDFENKTNVLSVKIYCREKGRIEIFANGILHHTGNCERNTYVTTKKQLSLPYFVTYTSRLYDAAGNKSILSEKAIYLPASADTSGKQRTCTAIFETPTNSFKNISCNWDQNDLVYLSTVPKSNNNYASYFAIDHDASVKVALTVISCKRKTLWDPRTWNSCVREVAQEQTLNGKVTILTKATEDLVYESNTRVTVYHKKQETLTLTKRYLLQVSATIGDQIIIGEKLSDQFEKIFAVDYTKQEQSAYFSWIFAQAQQVTQWHGNTAYEKPHSGIDFSVNKQQLLAPESGVIVAATYHKKTACFAGGNYIGIKHKNGLYTYYFHLSGLTYPNGTKIKPGDTVNRNQKLAVTGSTGMYNCEPLAPHLHFEMRKSEAATAHINPIPYFNIDWNTIKTARASTFPGRLSGENPHPKF